MLEIPVELRTLENGLRVLVSPDPTVPVVAVNLWYGVGSRNEREGRTGFAHLFEHMMFQGSANVPKNRHFELVERAGGTLNASTWFDRTNYFETVPAHHLDLALWLESDRLGWMLPALTQETLDNQRDVVKNEKRWRYDNQPYGDWDERIQRMLYPDDHPYQHTVIGSMEDLDAATLDDVESFFRTYYIPNNAVLTVCGDVDREAAFEAVRRHFGEIPAGPTPPPVPGPEALAPVLGETVREEVQADVPLARVYVGFRIPRVTSPEHSTTRIAVKVLGRGRASRLYRSLVRQRKLAKDVVAFAFPLDSGQSMMVVWATGLPHVDADTLQAALEDELDGLVTVQESEVARAAALAETALAREIETVGERADLLSMLDFYFQDAARINGEIDRLRSVTPADVRGLVEARFGPNNRAVLRYIPGTPT